MRNASGNPRQATCEAPAVPELGDAHRDRRGEAQAHAEPGRERGQYAETRADDAEREGQEAEASYKQASIDAHALQGRVIGHDGIELIGLNGGGVERRDGVHARSRTSPYLPGV